jgi:hypothetical protein
MESTCALSGNTSGRGGFTSSVVIVFVTKSVPANDIAARNATSGSRSTLAHRVERISSRVSAGSLISASSGGSICRYWLSSLPAMRSDRSNSKDSCNGTSPRSPEMRRLNRSSAISCDLVIELSSVRSVGPNRLSIHCFPPVRSRSFCPIPRSPQGHNFWRINWLMNRPVRGL